jgi:hypothetical protein
MPRTVNTALEQLIDHENLLGEKALGATTLCTCQSNLAVPGAVPAFTESSWGNAGMTAGSQGSAEMRHGVFASLNEEACTPGRHARPIPDLAQTKLDQGASVLDCKNLTRNPPIINVHTRILPQKQLGSLMLR